MHMYMYELQTNSVDVFAILYTLNIAYKYNVCIFLYTCMFYRIMIMVSPQYVSYLYVELRSGLYLRMKCFSFSFLSITLSVFILKKGKIKYFGSAFEQVAICPLTGIILKFSCLMCWLCSVTRFLRLLVSPM